MSSGELKSWILSAKGFLERSIPVWLAWSTKASMINWKLEGAVVVSPVDDMLFRWNGLRLWEEEGRLRSTS